MKGEHGASIIQTAYKKGDGDRDGDANQPRSTKYKVAIHANVTEICPLLSTLQITRRVATKSTPQREDVELRLFRFITAKGRRRYRAR